MFSIICSYQGYGSHKVISSFPIVIHIAYQLAESYQYPPVLLWIWRTIPKIPDQSLHTLFAHVISQVGGGHDGLVHGVDHLVIDRFPFIVIQKNLHGQMGQPSIISSEFCWNLPLIALSSTYFRSVSQFISE